MIEKFSEWLLLNRGYSDKTIRNYGLSLRLFDWFLKQIMCFGINDCEKIKVWHIEWFFREQRSLWKSVRTCNWYLAGIKLFMRYCLIEWYKVDDYRKIMFAKEPDVKIDALTDDDLTRLIDYFKNQPYNTETQRLIRLRNLIIVYLLAYTGLRVSELSNLKRDEMAEDMQIIGKWGKRRYITIHKDDMALIEMYNYLRKDNSEFLLVNHSNNYKSTKLSNVSIQQIIRTWAKKAWIEERVFPHKLRHTFATQLLRAKADLYQISQILWHSNLNSTQQYLTVLNCETKNTINLIPRFW